MTSGLESARKAARFVVGRSKSITGQYLDKAGMDMLHSGGSLFLATTNGPLIGLGHAGTLNAQGRDWFTSDFEVIFEWREKPPWQ